LTLAALRVRSFRFQWAADLFTSWAFEMETIVLGWYVMVNTGSVLLLTAFGSLQFLGTLAAPMFGVLGDRLGGRVILCAMRTVYTSLAAVVMVLALTGGLAPAWVFVVAALMGVVRPNDLVLRNTLIGETIPPAHLMGALGMSRATMDSARVGGALAGAGLSTMLGIGLTYVFVTCFYLASLALTFGVARARPVPDFAAPSPYPLPLSGERDWGWRELQDGVAHILSRPQLLAPMWLAFLINLTAYPASGGLLPYIAQRVYQVDATGLGWLAAAFSFGALLASIAMVVTGGPSHPERYTLVHTLLWYALLLVFAHVPTLGPGLLVLVATGFVQSVAMISMTGTLLTASGPGFRARVMGVRSLCVYGLPIGLIASGALIERIGYPLTVTAMAVAGLVVTALIALRWRAAMWGRARAVAA
jgi:MFS family permease